MSDLNYNEDSIQVLEGLEGYEKTWDVHRFYR